MTSCLLTLIATPELEEQLVDWLLESGHAGFTSAPCRGHGVHATRLSAAEQVAGVQRRVAFWIQTSESDARRVVSELSRSFGADRLHYWIAPVIEAGPIGPWA